MACKVQDDTEKVDGILQYLLNEIESLPDGKETSVLKLVDSGYECIDYNDGVFYWRIVKLSATILNDTPQMVFCSQDTYVDVC